MAKFTLKLEEDYPYVILGISSTTADYRLCWSINKKLGTQLKRVDPILIKTSTGEEIEHAFFEYIEENSEISYKLLSNKRGASRILREAEQADFLFMIDDKVGANPTAALEKIKSLRAVLLAFNIDLDGIKNKQNLMLTA